jgi:TonB-linked SusC/RagA family outer membrane protein
MKKCSLVLSLVLFTLGFALAQRTITGTVTDSNGEPLIGATVLVKGTATGTVTDINGNFSVNVPADAAALVFSYTGYASQEVTLGVSNVVNVTLEQDAAQLSEVVVVGYGTQSKRNVTSAISSVDSKAFENVSVQGFESALQGRLPGVNITGSAGTLGAPQAIRVRGVGSINASNQPLFVVDGVILNDQLGSNNVLGTASGTNPLININPNDIESIDVLKDAAAAAIYGSRGANGVILITTRQGKFNQKARVNIGYYAGYSEPTNQFDLMTGQEYASFWNQAARNRGFTPEANPTLFYDVASQPSTNWHDLVSQKGFVQEGNVGVSGGTQTTKYFFGGTYRDEDGWIRRTNLKRYSFRANIEQQISDKWTAGIQLNPSRTVNQRLNEDNNVSSPQTYSALFFPNVDAFDANGNVRGGIVTTSIGRGQFAGTPLVNLEESDIFTTTTQILANTYAEFRPISKLRLRTELGSQFSQVEDTYKTSSRATDGFGSGGFGSAANGQVLNWNWNTLATYFESVGRHDFDVTVGYTMQRETTTRMSVGGNTFADDRLKTLASAAEITTGTGTLTDVTFLGYLGRVNYSFDNKILLSASARIDGSSRFGTNNRYGFFPAVSAGWIPIEDRSSNFLNFLKVRGSWGLSGNAAIGNFDARGLIGFGTDYNMRPGFLFNRLENADLRWEKNQTVDFGVEFQLFNERVRGSALYYIRDTRDLLLDVPLPWTIGIVNALITRNAGEVRNQGFEFDAQVDVLKGPFRWTLGFNGATLNNEVRKLVDNNADGEDDDIVFGGRRLIRTGEPIGSWYLVRYAGVDPSNGNALFLDENGETLVNTVPASARVIAGNPLPAFSGGIYSDFGFKGFDLSVLFQYATGFQLYRNEAGFTENNMSSQWNQDRRILNAWTPENPNTDVPQARLLLVNGSQASTRYLSDGDFLRMKNIQLGYTTPPIGASGATVRVFVAGQNLLTFTQFTGLDPEANGLGVGAPTAGDLFFSRPQSKTYTMGFNLNF